MTTTQDFTHGTDEYGHWCQFYYGDVSQVLRWCPPGRFLMGSPKDEEDHFGDEDPQVEITFAEGFWIFDTTVTQELYEAMTGENLSYFAGRGKQLPVENVSWRDAQAFLDRLSEEIPNLTFRLPSEAQWEYACRAGSATPFEPSVARTHRGQSITPDEANYYGVLPYEEATKRKYRAHTVPVKGSPFRPNNWGLWHMHGNVWEWCEDIWNPSHEGADLNGLPRPRLESERSGLQFCVVRGGSWFDDARSCRSAFRSQVSPGLRLDFLGFRPVAEIGFTNHSKG